MGQQVSVDGGLLELQDLLKLDASSETCSGASALSPGFQHHVRAWRFESQGRSVADCPVPLRGEQGLADLQLHKDSSYLILHVYAEGEEDDDDEEETDVAHDVTMALEGLADQASRVCTPRGLATAQCQATPSRNPAEAKPAEEDGELRFSLYVWHGAMADARAKARSLSRAFLLEQRLQRGLLQARSFAALMARSPALLTSSVQGRQRCDSAAEAAAAVASACGGGSNGLLAAVLGGCEVTSPPPSISGGGHYKGRAIATPQNAGVRRFVRLGRSVWKSLEMGMKGPGPVHELQGEDRAEKRSTAKPAAQHPRAASIPEVTTPAPAPAAAAPAPAVPRLALGGLGLGGLNLSGGSGGGNGGYPPMTSRGGPEAMDVDESQADAGRKRARRPDNAAPAVGQAPSQAPPPLAMGILNLPPRTEPADCFAAEGASDRGRTDRSNEVPGPVLNLEEINMSEEELINSYDPDNEENNYHLPNHLLKRLQLGRFRQACSEAIEGKLFISGYMVPSNLELLKASGITHIVNMAADVCDNCFPDQFEYLTYYLKDANSEDLTPLFYRTLEWIQRVVDRGGRVLVHCREGVSRSATMVIAYIMWTQRIPFEAAHEKLRKARPICNPNTGFTCQLLVLARRLGISGQRPTPPADKASLFRVAPHNPKEPFLLLVPGELPQDGPVFDPRFGWVAQRGSELVLWIGAQVPDQDVVRETVLQHARWADVFEKRRCEVTVVHQGAEPSHFWQLLGRQAPPAESCGLAASKPALDADFEILKDCIAVKAACGASSL